MVEDRQQQLCHCSYKMIFMDILMPCMDGYEATRQLREMMRRHSIPSCPIIACPGESVTTEEDRAQYLTQGMTDIRIPQLITSSA